MSYQFDPHIHTAEVSPCGMLPAADVVRRYHALGYHGLVITDHLQESLIESLPCKDNWTACVDYFLQGYREAKKAATPLGMTVLLGAEIRFTGGTNTHREYLLYGINEAFLYDNPYLHRSTPEAFFARFGGAVLIIQAHPFRRNDTVALRAIHGIEVHNANPRHQSYNEKAAAYQRAHPHLLAFAGSDTHQAGDVGQAGVLLDARVETAEAFRAAVLAGAYTMFASPQNG